MIVCSSGTTGPSKGVVLSHAALTYQVLSSFELKANRPFLCFSSLYWLSGVLSLVNTTHRNAIRIITTKPFSAPLMIELIKTYKVEGLLTPPSQMALLLNEESLCAADLDSVTEYLCGGSHVQPEMARQMNGMLCNGMVRIGYGMSEIGGVASMTTTAEDLDCVGQLCNGMQLKVVDERGALLGVGERGELCMRCVFPILGYHGNETANRETIIDGWIHSGDVVYFDPAGNLHIVDRKKDILKYNNYQIDPSDIERVLMRLQGVIMVSVVGVPHPVHTDLPAAIIVKKDTSDLAEADVHTFVKDHLPNYKWLRGGVYFMDTIPLTASGKILKRRCKELVVDRYQNHVNRVGY